MLLDVSLSREGARSHNRIIFLYLNIIFTQISSNTGCQFGLFHLQQWGRGEISPDGSHPDWQLVSPGNPHSLCFRSPSVTWYLGPPALQFFHHPSPYLALFSLTGKCKPTSMGCFKFYFSQKKNNQQTSIAVSSELLWQLLSFPLRLTLGLLFKYYISTYLVSTTKL